VTLDEGRVALVGTAENQWARISVPSKEVMLQSVFEPGTGEATTDEFGTGRLQDSVVATPTLVVAGDDDDDVHPANDPAKTRADTIAMPAVRTGVWRDRTGRSVFEGRIGGVLHHPARLAIHHQPLTCPTGLELHDLMDLMVPCGIGRCPLPYLMPPRPRRGPAGCAGGRWSSFAWQCS